MLKHSGTQTLETKRLILRPFTVDDTPAMYKNWASNDTVTRFLTWPTHTSADTTKMLLTDWVSNYAKPDYYQWAIVLKDINEAIGSISIVHTNEDIDMVEIGYCIGQNWWHQGITSEALAAVIPFCFEELGANRVQAKHDVNNPNSGKVMAKCGMTYEGTLRAASKNHQGICDICVYSILKSEYDAAKSTR